jgi:two-component system, chemotaxis family, response regulator Rcp1
MDFDMFVNSQPVEILIADDQESDAFFVEQAFGQSSVANNVHWVKDGQEVLDFLNLENGYDTVPRPHLIIMDIKMPRKDGIETLAEIKSSERHKDIPVIIMSGSHAMEDVISAYRLQANAYVPKANGFEDMIAFVGAVEKFWFLKARLPQGV